MNAYAEIAVTTNYSFLRGASHPKELIEMAAQLGHAAIGIADRNIKTLDLSIQPLRNCQAGGIIFSAINAQA